MKSPRSFFSLATLLLSAATLLSAQPKPFFISDQDFLTGGTPQAVAVGDFNHDGKLDLAVAND